MNFKPTIHYPSPGAGLPAPDPLPVAAAPQWNKPRRKRRTPMNPWYRAYTGDEWRHPHGRLTYRFLIYAIEGTIYCRITKYENNEESGRLELDCERPLAAVRFKDIAIREQLHPVRRPNKYRTGPYISFWNWPIGFVKD